MKISNTAAMFSLACIIVLCCSGLCVCVLWWCLPDPDTLQISLRACALRISAHKYTMNSDIYFLLIIWFMWIDRLKIVCFQLGFHCSWNIVVYCYSLSHHYASSHVELSYAWLWIGLHQNKDKVFLLCCWQLTAECAVAAVPAVLGVSGRTA